MLHIEYFLILRIKYSTNNVQYSIFKYKNYSSIFTSVLLFNARPSSVLLSAIGCEKPYPLANTVRAYLLTKGIDPDRVTAKGYGFTQPVADNKTEEGRAQNRRTEVKILE